MALYKRGKYWWVSMWRNGRHVQKSTKLTDKKRARAVEQALSVSGTARDGYGAVLSAGTKKDDEGRNRELVLGLLRMVYGDSDDSTRIDSMWGEYLDVLTIKGKEVTPKNLRDKKSCIDKFIGWATDAKIWYIGQVDGMVAKRYALHLSEGDMSGKRRKNVIQHLSAVWNALSPNHRGIVNPWPTVSPSNVTAEERKIFTADEERKVLDACKEVHPQWYVASMIARHTGLRYGDVCRLTYGNINLDAGVIKICPNKTRRSSGVELVLPISRILMGVLKEWWAENPRRQPEDRVLPWLREYGPKDDRRFSTVLAKVGLDAKVYSFHTWRHSFRSALSRAGVSMDLAMKLCGHTTKEMSQRYDHTRYLPAMKDAVEKISEC